MPGTFEIVSRRRGVGKPGRQFLIDGVEEAAICGIAPRSDDLLAPEEQ